MEYKSPAIHRTPLYRAKSAYYSITQRCGNKNGKNPSYINVECRMTQEDFLQWAIPRYEDFNKNNPDERPNVARFGDAGHYELGNIELVTAKKNKDDQVHKLADIVHGTVGGYFKEKRRKLDFCDLCREAMRVHMQEYMKTHTRKRDRNKIGVVPESG